MSVLHLKIKNGFIKIINKKNFIEMRMKTSLICTTYNEEKTIGELLDSILKQTKVPDEIIIVDSLSKDNTTKIIRSFKDKKIKLIEKKCDIATGRNIAVKASKNNLILVTDGGCILDKKWCEEITKPFKDKSVKVAGGVFKPLAKNFFEKCEGVIVCKPIEKIDEIKFLPSSRSLAFKKDVWKKIGGYPIHKIGGEDTKFVLDLKERGFKIVVNKRAIAYWRMRSPLNNFIRQYYLYAVGDVKMGNIYRMKANLLFALLVPTYLLSAAASWFFYKPLAVALFGFGFFYFLYHGIKVALAVKNIRGIYYGFLLSFFKRAAYVFGIWREWVIPYGGRYKNENY